MIFEPGFSTAEEVTALSGRGVGMDVVKRTIDGLRGSIDIADQARPGHEVTLRLPLTLAIIDGLLVRVGADRYTIPLAAVEECVELLGGRATPRPGGAASSTSAASLVPFLRLRELFGAETPADAYQKVVVVSSGEIRVGLVVDQIIGNNQTVIKQLSRLHSRVKTFSGATILGDGSVALILDVMHLVALRPVARGAQPRRARWGGQHDGGQHDGGHRRERHAGPDLPAPGRDLRARGARRCARSSTSVPDHPGAERAALRRRPHQRARHRRAARRPARRLRHGAPPSPTTTRASSSSSSSSTASRSSPASSPTRCTRSPRSTATSFEEVPKVGMRWPPEFDPRPSASATTASSSSQTWNSIFRMQSGQTRRR